MEVSSNRDIPKSSIFCLGFSLINHPLPPFMIFMEPPLNNLIDDGILWSSFTRIDDHFEVVTASQLLSSLLIIWPIHPAMVVLWMGIMATSPFVD